MSQFGICYNPDVLRRLKLPPPAKWSDLADPGYAGTLALADPTKSGSVARAFELLVQGEILRALAENPADQPAALEAGWAAGLRLIQKLAANARYFTDSASKIPQDVGQGNAAAGMCIDFYGRSFADELTSATGTPRVVWIAPQGGTTLSADPIGMLKGAPHPEVAQAFVEFCLDGLEANEQTCEAGVEKSLSMCTSLNPLIGYEKAAKLAKEAFAENRTIRELCREKGILPEDTLTEALDPWKMTEPQA